MRVGSATAAAICMTRLVSSSEARSSLWKKRWRMWRTRTSNLFCIRAGDVVCACTASERTGWRGGAKRPACSDMAHRHGLDQLLSNGLRVLLLDQLCEDALEVGQREGGF